MKYKIMARFHKYIPVQKIGLLLCLVLTCSCHPTKFDIVVSPMYPRTDNLRVAVLNFDCKPGSFAGHLFYGTGTLGDSGKMIADLLTEELMKMPGIVVVERSRINAILDEKKLTMTGLTESPQLGEIASLAGIDAFITGSVGDASAINILGVFQESTVAFQARCIRAKDGVVLWSGSIVAGAASHNATRTLHAAAKTFGDELNKKISK